MKKNLLLAVCVAMIGVMFLGSTYAEDETSIGVSPSRIMLTNLRPGLKTTKQIVISRNNTEQEQIVELQLGESDLAQWVSLSPTKQLVLRAGENHATATINIDVPITAAFGKYTGEIKIILKDADIQSGVNIEPAVIISLDFIVSDKTFKEIKIISAKIDSFLVNNNLRLLLNIDNLGNVPAGPGKMVLEISNVKGEAISVLEKVNTTIVEPLSSFELMTEFDTKSLAVGDYIAKLTIYDDEQQQIYQQTLSFKIQNPQVTPTPVVEESSVSIYLYLGLIVFGLILIILAIYNFRKNK